MKIMLKAMKRMMFGLVFVTSILLFYKGQVFAEDTTTEDTTYDKNYTKIGHHLEPLKHHSEPIDADSGMISYIEPDVSRFMNPNTADILNSGGLNASDTAIKNSVVYKNDGKAPPLENFVISYDTKEDDDYTGVSGLNATKHQIILKNIGNGPGNRFGYTVSAPWNKRDGNGNLTPNTDWGYAYFGIAFAYSKTTQMYYFVATYHIWYGTLSGLRGTDEYHPTSYLIEYDEYSILPNNYTVQYDANGGSGIMASETMTYDKSYTAEKCSFTPPLGMEFSHWTYTDDNGNKKIVEAEGVLKNLTAKRDGVVTLKAVYTGKKYTIIYHPNGGRGLIGNQTFTYDGTTTQTVTLKTNTYSKTGYRAGEWAMTEDGLGTYYTKNGVSFTQDLLSMEKTFSGDASDTNIHLYSTWTEYSYFIRYQYDDAPISKRVTKTALRNFFSNLDSVYSLGFSAKSDIATSGFRFDRWFTNTAYTGTSYTNEKVVRNLADTGSTITLYGRWYANIIYNKNFAAANEPSYSKTVYESSTFTASNNNFSTPTGYTFNGWNTKASGDGTTFNQNKTYVRSFYSNLGISNGEANVYAKWKPNAYTIKFDGSGAEGTMANLSMTYDVAKKLPYPTYSTPTGYTFSGWRDNATGITYKNNQSVTNLTSTSGGVVTLTALWNPITYTVRFDANGGSGTMDDLFMIYDMEAELPESTFIAPAGMKLSGWKHIGTGVTYEDKETIKNLASTSGAVVTLKAQWTVASPDALHTITFDYNKPTNAPEEITGNQHKNKTLKYNNAYGVLPTPKLYGFLFGGWYTEKGVGRKITTASIFKKTTDETLYANWREERYSVTYDSNNTTNDTDYDDCYGYTEVWSPMGNMFTIPKGYLYYGWNTKTDGSGMDFDEYEEYRDSKDNFIKNHTTGYTGEGFRFTDLTLYAQWRPISYKVKFDANGGSGTMSDQTMTYDTASNLLAATFTAPDGMQFAGWKDSKTETSYGNKQSVVNLASTSGAVVTLKAQWKPITYTVTFDYNQPGYHIPKPMTNNTVTSVELEYGAKYATSNGTGLPRPKLYGHSFAGWYTAKIGGSWIKEGYTVFSQTTNQTIYAHWNKQGLYVIYDSNNGTEETDECDYLYGEDFWVEDNDFEHPNGAEFIGWNTQADGSGDYLEDDYPVNDIVDTYTKGYDVDTNLYLYAQWYDSTAHTYKVAYHANGGTGIMNPQNVTYNKEVTIKESAFTAPTGTYFAGWEYTDKNGVVKTANPGDTFTNLTDIKDGVVTMKAKWMAHTYMLTLDSNTDLNSSKQNPSDLNGVFYQWYNVGYYKEEAHTTKYASGSLITSSIPTKKHYTFLGYYSGNDVIVDEKGKLTNARNNLFLKNTVLYGKWSPNVYSIKIDKNTDADDTIEQESDITTVYEKYDTGFYTTKDGNTKTTLDFSIPVADGYDFMGYYTTTDEQITDKNGVLLIDITPTTFTEDTTIIATYKKAITKFDVEYYDTAENGDKIYNESGTIFAYCETYKDIEDDYTVADRKVKCEDDNKSLHSWEMGYKDKNGNDYFTGTHYKPSEVIPSSVIKTHIKSGYTLIFRPVTVDMWAHISLKKVIEEDDMVNEYICGLNGAADDLGYSQKIRMRVNEAANLCLIFGDNIEQVRIQLPKYTALWRYAMTASEAALEGATQMPELTYDLDSTQLNGKIELKFASGFVENSFDAEPTAVHYTNADGTKGAVVETDIIVTFKKGDHERSVKVPIVLSTGERYRPKYYKYIISNGSWTER